MKSVIGRKIGMTSVFTEDGTTYPVTVVEVLPNVVLQKKTIEKDGYEALQVGYEDKKESRANKCELGIAKKANTTPKYFIKELEGDEIYSNHEVGQTVDCSVFEAGDAIDVIAKSKGHGYTGVIKRYHAHIGPKGHGSGYHRQIGSLATNGRCNNRVHAGKKMGGQWRPQTTTIHNLVVVDVNLNNNYLLIKGSVPGPKYSVMKIRSAIKALKPKFPVSKLVNYKTETVEQIEKIQEQALEAKAKEEAAIQAEKDKEKKAN